MNVKIYIETSLRGPAIKDGYYASVIEYQTSKGPMRTKPCLSGRKRHISAWRKPESEKS